jgi:hypothetical protein
LSAATGGRAADLEVSSMVRSGNSTSRRRVGAGTLVAAVLTLAAMVPTAQAASLNPPPPDFEQCHGSGTQTICHGVRIVPGHLEPSDIFCGSGSDAFEIFDSADFIRQEATRWYDAGGNLVRRMIHEVWVGSAWTNPLAGTSVRYNQMQTFIDEFSVPGDLGSATETTTGALNFVLPGSGAIVQATGRTVIGADGTLEFRAGPQAIIDYFFDGDLSAFDPLCEALAG